MAKKDSRLNGLNPLSYVGANAYSPPNLTTNTRAPTVNDNKNFDVGALWIDTSAAPQNVWMLVSLSGGTATWLELSTGIVPPWTVPQGGTGQVTLTDHGVMVGSGVAAVTSLAVGTDGQVLLGSTGADPVFATLASAGATVLFTPGAGTLNLETGATVPTQFDADGGSAVPALGVLTVAGGTNVTTAGAGSTITINATPDVTVATTYTSDAGNATPAANVINVLGGTNVDTAGAGSTVTINATTAATVATTYTTDAGNAAPAANVINILGGINVDTAGAGSTVTVKLSDVTDHSLVVGSGAAALTELGVATNGQIPIGSTGADPVLATITAGANITVNNSAGGIEIVSTGGGSGSAICSFWARVTPSYSATGISGIFSLGQHQVMTILYDTGGDFYPGDGAGYPAGLPAAFTAPQDGKYLLTFSIFYPQPSVTWMNTPTQSASATAAQVSTGPTFTGSVARSVVADLTMSDVINYRIDDTGGTVTSTYTYVTGCLLA